jgi:hypothetical protein
MTVERQSLGAVLSHYPNLRIAIEPIGEIDETSVHQAGERGTGEPRRDPFRNVAYVCAGGNLPP